MTVRGHHPTRYGTERADFRRPLTAVEHCKMTSGNLERFWLSGAAHKRLDECTVPNRAGEPKTC